MHRAATQQARRAGEPTPGSRVGAHVTGGSGFVGGHVIERLREGHEERAMSRSVTVKTDKARAEPGDSPATSVADGLAAMPRLA